MYEKPSSFFQSGVSRDPLYSHVRDYEPLQEVRTAIEEMWKKYNPLCPDPDFLSQAKEDFISCTWQMHLTILLIDQGFNIKKPPKNGPDNCLIIDNKHCWIEGVAPTAGDGPDAVQVRKIDTLPEEKIILRFLSSIENKMAQYRDWLSKGIVSQSEPFIIAGNGGKIPLAYLHLKGEPSFIEKAVFPIGNRQFHLALNSGEIINESYAKRESILKTSGTEIPTTLFIDNDYQGITAVMFSPHWIADSWNRYGSDIETVHNFSAKNPIPLGIFNLVSKSGLKMVS